MVLHSLSETRKRQGSRTELEGLHQKPCFYFFSVRPAFSSALPMGSMLLHFKLLLNKACEPPSGSTRPGGQPKLCQGQVEGITVPKKVTSPVLGILEAGDSGSSGISRIRLAPSAVPACVLDTARRLASARELNLISWVCSALSSVRAHCSSRSFGLG